MGGIDLNNARMRHALNAVIALAAAPNGFTVAEFTAKVHAMTGHTDADYSIRQAAYDLRKIRGMQLIHKPNRTRPYRVPATAVRSITALLTLREHVLAPIDTGINSADPPPAQPIPIDRAYQTLRADMHDLLAELGIATTA